MLYWLLLFHLQVITTHSGISQMRIYLLKQIKHKPSYLKVFKMIKCTHSIQICPDLDCVYVCEIMCTGKKQTKTNKNKNKLH